PVQEAPEAPVHTEVPQAPEMSGREFYVEPGHGFTHEIQEFAQANGSQVDGKRAFEIYEQAVARFGQDGLIEPTGTYVRDAGDIGISAPGSAAWKPGVAESLKSQL